MAELDTAPAESAASSAPSDTVAVRAARLDRELCNLLSESALQRASSARLSLEVAVEPQSLLAFYRIPMVSFVMRGWAHLVGMALCGLQIALSTSTEEVAQREMEIALGLHDDGAKAVPALSATELAQFVNVAALVLDNLLATVDAIDCPLTALAFGCILVALRLRSDKLLVTCTPNRACHLMHTSHTSRSPLLPLLSSTG